MKKILYMMAMLLVFTACHTTEENYKKAYDKAMERTKENQGLENYITEETKRAQANEVVNGDSVRVVRSYVNIIDGKATDMKKYGVAIAEFDQVINARSYRDRLKAKQGFESYVVYSNKDKKYIVIVQGYDNKGAAANFIQHIDEFLKMKVLVPRAYILQRL